MQVDFLHLLVWTNNFAFRGSMSNIGVFLNELELSLNSVNSANSGNLINHYLKHEFESV